MRKFSITDLEKTANIIDQILGDKKLSEGVSFEDHAKELARIAKEYMNQGVIKALRDPLIIERRQRKRYNDIKDETIKNLVRDRDSLQYSLRRSERTVRLLESQQRRNTTAFLKSIKTAVAKEEKRIKADSAHQSRC